MGPCFWIHVTITCVFSCSFHVEEQQGPSVNQLALAHNPNTQVISASFPQPAIVSDSNLVTLETPQDYIQLWQQPTNPQHHLFLQVNTWPCTEQATVQAQATWPQVYQPLLFCPPSQVRGSVQAGPLLRKEHSVGVRSIYEIQTTKLNRSEGSPLVVALTAE